jgi:hypothetical protein
MNIPEGFRAFIQRDFLRVDPHYIISLKNALEKLSRNADEQLREKISECLQTIEMRNEGIEKRVTDSLIARKRRYEAMKKIHQAQNMMEFLDEEKILFFKKNFLEKYQIRQSKCAYCGKIIPKGQDVCNWCGHEKRDDDDRFLPYPYIFKPPGPDGAMKGLIAVPIKVKALH